jgi:Ni,Fe-hydrogenase III small subunit/Pyruvate/2-oxoacid:ferredoxin oxidoreductase delta subunit
MLLKNKNKTMIYPNGPLPALPPRFAGLPSIDQNKCTNCSSPCIKECPTGALSKNEKGLTALDMGRCLFCRDCEEICPKGAIQFTKSPRLAAHKREDLIFTEKDPLPPLAISPQAKTRYGKSLKRSCSLRVVSTGGCGACEADTNVLTTLAWDLSRFGIHYVASPRHADGLIIIGPQTKNMREALKITYDAIPEPKFVIALGTCAISGGLYANTPECSRNDEDIIPVDLYIPGCPPHPLTILDALLRYLGIPYKQDLAQKDR